MGPRTLLHFSLHKREASCYSYNTATTQCKKASNMKTVQQFVQECASLSSDEIYEKFYDEADDVRDAVYAEAASLGVVFEDENEPTRASMYALGVKYDVQSLRDY